LAISSCDEVVIAAWFSACIWRCDLVMARSLLSLRSNAPLAGQVPGHPSSGYPFMLFSPSRIKSPLEADQNEHQCAAAAGNRTHRGHPHSHHAPASQPDRCDLPDRCRHHRPHRRAHLVVAGVADRSPELDDETPPHLPLDDVAGGAGYGLEWNGRRHRYELASVEVSRKAIPGLLARRLR